MSTHDLSKRASMTDREKLTTREEIIMGLLEREYRWRMELYNETCDTDCGASGGEIDDGVSQLRNEVGAALASTPSPGEAVHPSNMERLKALRGTLTEKDVPRVDRILEAIDVLDAVLEPGEGLVLDLREVFYWESDGPKAVYLDEVVTAIKAQIPGVKVVVK